MSKVARSFRIDSAILADFESKADLRGMTRTAALEDALAAWSKSDGEGAGDVESDAGLERRIAELEAELADERDRRERREEADEDLISSLREDKRVLREQMERKDAQLAEAQSATQKALDLVAEAQRTAQGAQALQARSTPALESEEQKRSRWRWPWSRG